MRLYPYAHFTAGVVLKRLVGVVELAPARIQKATPGGCVVGAVASSGIEVRKGK
jgi:hypothetical protein